MNLEKFLNAVLSDTHGGDNHLYKAISLSAGLIGVVQYPKIIDLKD